VDFHQQVREANGTFDEVAEGEEGTVGSGAIGLVQVVSAKPYQQVGCLFAKQGR
jgi:hypothetical protein